jgi:hypothetical protein
LMEKLKIELEQSREGEMIRRTIKAPQKPSRPDIDALLHELQELRAELDLHDEIDITIELTTS